MWLPTVNLCNLLTLREYYFDNCNEAHKQLNSETWVKEQSFDDMPYCLNKCCMLSNCSWMKVTDNVAGGCKNLGYIHVRTIVQESFNVYQGSGDLKLELISWLT